MTIDVITSIGTSDEVKIANSLSELRKLGKKIMLFVMKKGDDKFRSYGEFKLRSLLQLNVFENPVSYINVEGKSTEKIIKELKKDSVMKEETGMHPDFKIDWVIGDLAKFRDQGADIVKIIWTLPKPDWAEDVISKESTRVTDGEYIYQLGVM